MTSWQGAAVSLLARITVKQLVRREGSVERFRAGARRLEKLSRSLPRAVQMTTEDPLPNCDAEWLKLRDTPTDRVLLHFPGGAFVIRLPAFERAMVARMCVAATASARIVHYRLAPEHPFPAGHDDCVGAYRQLLDLGVEPARIVLSGISAGGAMVLSVLLALRDQGLPMPAGAVAMSPVTDLTDPRAGTRVSNQLQDAVLSGERGMEMRDMYVGGRQELLHDPYVSPVFGDFHGLPPLYFQVGAREILLDDSRRCAARATAAGVSAEVEVWPGMQHGWQGVPFMPESARAIEHLADFVRRCCP